MSGRNVLGFCLTIAALVFIPETEGVSLLSLGTSIPMMLEKPKKKRKSKKS